MRVTAEEPNAAFVAATPSLRGLPRSAFAKWQRNWPMNSDEIREVYAERLGQPLTIVTWRERLRSVPRCGRSGRWHIYLPVDVIAVYHAEAEAERLVACMVPDVPLAEGDELSELLEELTI